ncbi:MAG: UDP-N-acetylglucosamine 2-epimerase (non-hydrolyzing) [Candidatus Competibacteraceae bacterium]
MLKLITLVGTRPELIRLACVIAELDKYIQQIIVHTGQNYDFELNEVFFRDLALRKPDHFLDAAGPTAAATIAQVIERFDQVLEQERPDALLVLGDTNSCLGAIPAKRRKIPIFHMEAGNRCFDQRVPEETNRRIVDHISDINLVYTEHGRRYLLAEGIRPDTVIKTGSPMREVLTTFAANIAASDVLDRLGLTPDSYFLVSAHREENVDDPIRLATLLVTLDALAAEYNRRVIFSVHPRTRTRIETFGLTVGPAVHFMKPLGFFDYNCLQQNAFCVVSDSGTITEESAILGFPAITIREAHERPEGMDEGILIMTGLHKERVLESVRVVRAQRHEIFHAPLDYAPDNVSKKVARIILSYTNYVKRTVWFE